MSEEKKFELNELDKAGWIRVALTFVIYVLGIGLFFYLEHNFFDAEALASSLSLPVEEIEEGIGGVAFGIAMLLVTVLFAVVNRELLKEQFHHMLEHPKKVAIWACIGACLVYVIMTLNHHFLHGPHHAYTEVSNQIAGVWAPLMIIAMSFGMAFVEEMSYKVCCFLPVEGLELKIASLCAAVLYGLMNLIVFAIFAPHYALGAFLMYTLLGLKFGLLYYNTHTVFTSIFAGTIYSLVTIIIALL